MSLFQGTSIRDVYQAQHDAMLANQAYFLAKQFGSWHDPDDMHRFFTTTLAEACHISGEELGYIYENQDGAENRTPWGTDATSRKISKKLAD